MRFVVASVIASGLGVWLGSGGARPNDGVRRDAPGELVQLDEADEQADEGRPLPPPPGPHLPRGIKDGPDRGPFGGERGRRGFGPKFPGPEAKPMTSEQVDRLMQFTQQHLPKLHEPLARLRGSNPRAFRRMLHRVHGVLRDIMETKKHNPELADKMIQSLQVEMELKRLQNEHRTAASEGQRAAIRLRIREQLDKRFDLRLDRLRFEIGKLERRLEEARGELAKRESGKEKFIDEELERFLAGKREELPGRRGPMMRKRGRLPPPPSPPSPEKGDESNYGP